MLDSDIETDSKAEAPPPKAEAPPAGRRSAGGRSAAARAREAAPAAALAALVVLGTLWVIPSRSRNPLAETAVSASGSTSGSARRGARVCCASSEAP